MEKEKSKGQLSQCWQVCYLGYQFLQCQALPPAAFSFPSFSLLPSSLPGIQHIGARKGMRPSPLVPAVCIGCWSSEMVKPALPLTRVFYSSARDPLWIWFQLKHLFPFPHAFSRCCCLYPINFSNSAPSYPLLTQRASGLSLGLYCL